MLGQLHRRANLPRVCPASAICTRARPDAWRGVEPRERVIKQALFGILKDVAEVERIFPILKAQSEY